MNISIISSKDNLEIAMELMRPEIHNHVTREFSDNSPFPRTLIKRKLLVSDLILVLIDEKFESNSYLSFSSKMASIVAKEEPSIALIPIILNNAKIPEIFAEWICISCNTSSPESIATARSRIVKNIVRRNASHDPYIKMPLKKLHILKLVLNH